MSIEWDDDLEFGEFEKRLSAILPDALEAGGNHIKDEANDKTPLLVDLVKANKKRRTQVGYLRDSAFVRVEGLLQVAIGYTAYWARWQHERPDYHHVIGEFKWLERTLLADGHEALRKVADRIREGLAGG